MSKKKSSNSSVVEKADGTRYDPSFESDTEVNVALARRSEQIDAPVAEPDLEPVVPEAVADDADIEWDAGPLRFKVDKQGRLGRNSSPGRPTVWNETMRQEIVLAIGDGASLDDAAKLVTIMLHHLQLEMQRNALFRVAVERAQVVSKLWHLRRVRDGVPQWQSSAWFLERRFRREFSLAVPPVDDVEKTIRVRNVVRSMTLPGSAALAPLPDTSVDQPSPLSVHPGVGHPGAAFVPPIERTGRVSAGTLGEKAA